MQLFLATGLEAPLVAWDASRPGFNVSEISAREAAVRAQFSKPKIRCVGSHTMCGCGFRSLNRQPDGGHLPLEYAVVEDPEKCAADHAALASYLRERLLYDPDVELYAVWDGEWAEDCESRTTVTADEVASPDFFFLERGFYRVAAAVPAN